jgi:beta-lactamase regulating signal transducer with metallopeptidase domain
MNPLAALLSADPLLEVLVRIALVATAVAALSLLAVRCSRRAATRHAQALAGATVLLAVPLLVVAAQQIGFGVPLLGAAPLSANAQPDAPAAQIMERAAAAPVNAPLPAAASTPSAKERAPAAATATLPPPGVLALFLWLGAAGIALAFELRAARAVNRLRAHCRPLADPVLAAHAAAAARDLGLHAVPPLLQSDALPCPATIGIRRPVIVLPAALLKEPARAAAPALLRHELAHVALGHPRQSLLQCALRVLFGWHPFARALAGALGDAQEEVADNAALGGGAPPLAYARALVAFAEQSLHLPRAPQALFARGGRPFTRRIVRLTHDHRDLMIRPTARGRALASCLAAAAVLAPLTVRMLPAQTPEKQSPAAKAGEHSGAAFMPLAEGTCWTWTNVRTDEQGKAETSTSHAVAWGEVPLDGKTTCTQLLTDGFVEYWSADEHGVFQHATDYLGHQRGVNARSRTRLLAAPVGAETRWEWDEMMSYQTMGDAPPRDPEDDRIHNVAELLGVDDEVAVPAGRFRCAHVRITATNRTWSAPWVRELWFGRGAGLVQEKQTGQSGTVERTLTAFTAGKPVAHDPAAALAAWRKALPARQTAPTIEWLPAGELAFWLHGRFAVARFADDDVHALWLDARATEFDPRDTKFWNELRQGQSVFRWGIGVQTAAGAQATLQFNKNTFASWQPTASILAQIEAARRGLKLGDTSTETDADHERCIACATGADGKEVEVRATFTFADGVITGAEVTVGPLPAGQQKAPGPQTLRFTIGR